MSDEGGGTLVTPDIMIGGGYNDWYWQREGSTIEGVEAALEINILGYKRDDTCQYCFETDAICPQDEDEAPASTSLQFDTDGHCIDAFGSEEFTVSLSTVSDCLSRCPDTGTGSGSDVGTGSTGSAGTGSGTGSECCRPERNPAVCIGCIQADKHDLAFDGDGHLKSVIHRCGEVVWGRELQPSNADPEESRFDGIRLLVYQIRGIPLEEETGTGTGSTDCLNPGQGWDVYILTLDWDADGHLILVNKAPPVRYQMPPGGCCTGAPTITFEQFNFRPISGSCSCSGIVIPLSLVGVFCDYGEGIGCFPAYIWEYTGPPLKLTCELNGDPNGELTLLSAIAVCGGGAEIDVSVGFQDCSVGFSAGYDRCCNGGPTTSYVLEGNTNIFLPCVVSEHCDWDWRLTIS